MREDGGDALYQTRVRRVMKHSQFASTPMHFRMADTSDDQCEPCFSVPESHSLQSAIPDLSSDELDEILSLQTAEGGFVLSSEETAASMEIEMSELQDAAAKMKNGGDDAFKLACTAVILALLEHDFGDRRGEWFAVTEKSRKWMKAQVAQLNPTVNGKALEEWARDYVEGIAA